MHKRFTGFCLILLVLSDELGAVHHWKLRDDGKGYEPVYDSPFVLSRKRGMTHVLQQDEDIKTMGQSLVELVKKLKNVNVRQKYDDPDIEERVKETSKDCLANNEKDYHTHDFFARFPHEGCKEFHDLFPDIYTIARGYIIPKKNPSPGDYVPICSKVFADGDINMKNAQWYKLDGISPTLLQDMLDSTEIREMDALYGEIVKAYFRNILVKFEFSSEAMSNVAYQLFWLMTKATKAKYHPYLHMAAAAYFRAIGATHWAFSCYQTAAALLKDGRWKGEPIVRDTLNDVLHTSLISLLFQVGKHEEGLTLFDAYYSQKVSLNNAKRPACFNIAATAIAGDLAYISAIRTEDGDVIIENLARSKEHYLNAVELSKDNKWTPGPISKPWPEELLNKAYFAGCQLDISSAIFHQLDNMASFVKETVSLSSSEDARLSLEDRIVSRMANSRDVVTSELMYEEHRYGPNPLRRCKMYTIKKRDPFTRKMANVRQFKCKVAKKDWEEYRMFMDDIMQREELERPPPEDPWRTTEIFTTDHEWVKKMKNLKGHSFDSPQLPVKYPLNKQTLDTVKDRFWRRSDWPSPRDCQELWFVGRSKSIFNQDSFPEEFLTLEDKGYNVAEYVTKWIGVEDTEEHPYPWDDPICEFVDFKRGKTIFDQFKSVHTIDEMWLRNEERYAEPQLRTIVKRLAGKIMSDREMVGRINSLYQHDIGPRWLVLNLAGLIWRMKGCPKRALHCLMGSVLAEPSKADAALIQIAQVVLKVTRNKEEALEFLRMAAALDRNHPLVSWLMGRVKMLTLDFDGAVFNLKDSLEKDPFNERVAEDLITLMCSGKTAKPVIPNRFPTVCCSPVISHAVCFKVTGIDDNCYVLDDEGKALIYNRCNGIYTGNSYKTTAFAVIISPFLPIMQSSGKRDAPSFDDEIGGAMTIETEELSLESGGADQFFVQRPMEWWGRAKNEMIYELAVEKQLDYWEIDVPTSLAPVPPKPLSHLWVSSKKEMLNWDIDRPRMVPKPTLHQIRTGLSVFPPPRLSSCSNIPKLITLLELQASTWVSVTAKGEDIEKHVDLKGPVPSIAGLVPNCPVASSKDVSPMLAMDHLPVFSLSDQFLFYKAEKTLTDALKSIGADKDTIEHVAARLHTAILANGIRDGKVNWLLCVLSSLYWRVVGDAPKAMSCLRTALMTAPRDKRDIVLISIANIAYQAGLTNSALAVSAAALTISNTLVSTHFTIGNIYASMGEYQRALEFYYSTLSLQANFEPAKDRIRAILCHSGEKFDFHYLF